MRSIRQWAMSVSPRSPRIPNKSKFGDEEMPSKEIDYVLDDEGRVLASEGVVAPHPWKVVPSSNYSGHHYFFNTTTSEAAWSLDLKIFKNIKCAEEEPRLPPSPPNAREHERPQSVDLDESGQDRQIPDGPTEGASQSKLSLDLSVIEAGLGEFSFPSTPDGPELSKKNATMSCLGTSLDSIAMTKTISSQVSSDSSASTCSTRLKQRLYPTANPDGTSSVEVVAGLGSGGYACVCLVKPARRSCRDEELMAMKVVSKLRNKRPKDKKRLQTELNVMRDPAPSRFLQRCHAAFESATDVFFVCDYLAGGDLFYHMVKRIQSGKGPFPEEQAKNVLAEVTLGLVHLHERGFIHRDLKVENLMLDASGHVKIIDFGLAVKITSSTGQPMSPTGSLSYMAPELIKSGDKSGGCHTDWWAMGVLAYELMTGRAPWSSLSDKVVIRHEIQNCKVVPPATLSSSARQLIESLLEVDFRRRLGFEDDGKVKKAEFFSGVDWPAVERGDTPPPIKLDVFGPDVVNAAESKNAIDIYMNKMGAPSSAFFSEAGRLGVKSPFFVGVDVITTHPPVNTQRRPVRS